MIIDGVVIAVSSGRIIFQFPGKGTLAVDSRVELGVHQISVVVAVIVVTPRCEPPPG